MTERKVLLRFFDVLFVLIGLYLLGNFFNFQYFKVTPSNYSWGLFLSFYVLFFGAVFEMYNLQVASNQFQTIRSIILTTTSIVVAYLLTPVITPLLPSKRLEIIYFYFVVLFSLFVWRMLYLNFFASHRFVKNVVLVCDGEQAEELITDLQNADPHYRVLAFINSYSDQSKEVNFKKVYNITVQQLERFAKRSSISEIVIASQHTEGITVELYNELLRLLENGLTIREYTQVYETSTQRIPVHYVARDFYRYFPFSRSNHNQLYLISVRIIEWVVSLIGILIGVCLIPIILIGNFIGSRGPLFYTQQRVGKNGKPFEIYKFRTMVKNAESEGAVFAIQNDMRITPFGRFLRKTRIDEFPQFINVLKGDMAVIGPRPERPFFVAEIAEQMPFYETRHVIKPGLTGWAQVNYSYGESIEDSLVKLQYDLYYIKHRSIFLDVNIVIKTISTVLFYRGQ